MLALDGAEVKGVVLSKIIIWGGQKWLIFEWSICGLLSVKAT